MPKLIVDVSNSPDDCREIKVKDFAEATYYLVADLIDTADTDWSVDSLREWLGHYYNVASPDDVSVEVVKNNSIHGDGPDTTTFRYDPSDPSCS